MRENVVSLRAVFPDGQIVTTRRKVLKSSVGYNLTQLLIGSEGTLAVMALLCLVSQKHLENNPTLKTLVMPDMPPPPRHAPR
jgi:FAD/FMN-containing dehydrogenase